MIIIIVFNTEHKNTKVQAFVINYLHTLRLPLFPAMRCGKRVYGRRYSRGGFGREGVNAVVMRHWSVRMSSLVRLSERDGVQKRGECKGHM